MAPTKVELDLHRRTAGRPVSDHADRMAFGARVFFLFCPVPAPTEAMPGEEARADSRTAVPEALRHSLLLQEEIAKMSDNKSEEKGEEPQGGSLQRWQGPYWWKSLKGKTAPR